MANCSNCKTKLGCSCKKRVSSNKISCCVNCIGAIEASLKKSKPTVVTSTAPVITNVSATRTN